MRVPYTPKSARPHKHYRTLLVLLVGAQFMLAVDGSVVTIALPTIGRALGFTPSTEQWVLTGYVLPYGGLLLLGGKMSDRWGHGPMFLASVATFTAASAAAGLAWSPALLVGARAVQGCAGAGMAPAALALITDTFEEQARTRALAVNGAMVGLGFAAGLAGGGILTASVGWRSAVLINVPIGVVGLSVAPCCLPRGSHAHGDAINYVSALLLTGGLIGLGLAFTSAASLGLRSPTAPILLGAYTVVMFAAGFRVERTSSAPLLPVQLRHDARLLAVIVMITTASAGMGGSIVLASLYLQQVLRYGPWQAAYLLAGSALVAAIAGPVVARCVSGLGGQAALVAALAVQMIGAAWIYVELGPENVIPFLGAMALEGSGHVAAYVAAAICVAERAMPPHLGVTGAALTAAAEIGSALGTVALVTIATIGGEHGMQNGLMAGGALAAVSVALGVRHEAAIR